MQISFLLVNYNMRGLVERCIESIARECVGHACRAEIIVAENSSDPAYAMNEAFVRARPLVTVVQTDRTKRGWGHAVNQLLPRARGEFVCLLHPDVEFRPGAVAGMLGFMGSHPNCGILSPNMSYPDGSLNRIRIEFVSVRSEFFRLVNMLSHIVFRRKFFADEVFWNRECDTESELVMSVCMLIRRKALEAAGLIPAELDSYYVNDWLCWRVGQAAWKIWWIKDSQVIHFERFSDREGYSGRRELVYKANPIPASSRIERDKFVFLKYRYAFHKIMAVRCINTAEYLVHCLALIRKPREEMRAALPEYLRAIRAVWGGGRTEEEG